jgi:hypothetical protein
VPSGSPGALSQDYSHTGNYSLKYTTPTSIDFSLQSALPGNYTVNQLNLVAGKKYLLSFWVKSAGPSFTGIFYTQVNTGAMKNVLAKTPSIDGWTQMEAEIDLSGASGGGILHFYISPFTDISNGLYLDDIRIMPLESNMKSFVYDPTRFRLAAQLDENNMATFYEYDQEGLLIRTKKETERGIMTINESRRSNVKQ